MFEHIYTTIEKGLAEKTDKHPLIIVYGPTAVGKTASSIAIATQFNAEVISVDSRQVYTGMDIGTDKITKEEMDGVVHHMLDVVDPDEPFSLADFMQQATQVIDDIHARGKIPMLVGGTTLYTDSLAKGYVLTNAKPNEELRKKLQATDPEELYANLKEQDPEAAERIHANNVRYVIRALEKIASGENNAPVQEGSPYNCIKIGLFRPRHELYERINARVDEQVESGILEELKALLKKYPREVPSMTSLGYKEYFPYLDGEGTLEASIEKLKKNTRNYAKRQLTWMRKDQSISWFCAKTGKNLPSDILSTKSPQEKGGFC